MTNGVTFVIALLLINTLFSIPAAAVQPDVRGPSETVAPENNPEMIELHRIRFENKKDGAITILQAGETQWTEIGRVSMPAGYLKKEGYTASGWAPRGRVAATAVNAVHIKVRQNKNRGVMLSILPKEYAEKPKDYNSYYSKNTSIMTDMPAGSMFFGGPESPFVGSPILLERNESKPAPLPEMYYPEEGDAITVIVERPARYPREIEFENRFGGYITIRYPDGESKIIAQVHKPVYGTGRFGGSLHTGIGRIRANHTGVLCVSTSPPNVIGGFQILPENHAMSPEMIYARIKTQWMVVGPPSVLDPSTEGVAPLFKYFLRPIYYAANTSERTIEEMLNAFIIQVRLNNGEWQNMPELNGLNNEGLKTLTHIRILFPIESPDWMK